MVSVAKNYDRVTFSLPKNINTMLDNLKKESKTTKSEIIQQAIEKYIELQQKQKLYEAVEAMSHEYQSNQELTVLTKLDSEDFL